MCVEDRSRERKSDSKNSDQQQKQTTQRSLDSKGRSGRCHLGSVGTGRLLFVLCVNACFAEVHLNRLIQVRRICARKHTHCYMCLSAYMHMCTRACMHIRVCVCACLDSHGVALAAVREALRRVSRPRAGPVQARGRPGAGPKQDACMHE